MQEQEIIPTGSLSFAKGGKVLCVPKPFKEKSPFLIYDCNVISLDDDKETNLSETFGSFIEVGVSDVEKLGLINRGASIIGWTLKPDTTCAIYPTKNTIHGTNLFTMNCMETVLKE